MLVRSAADREPSSLTGVQTAPHWAIAAPSGMDAAAGGEPVVTERFGSNPDVGADCERGNACSDVAESSC